MARSAAVVQAIRALLRERGMTYRDLAQALGLSEPTIKRDLSRGDFSLGRLDRICDVLDVSLGDLVHGAGMPALTQLSEKQEKALVRDRKLLLVTYLIVNDWTSAEITSTFDIDDSALVDVFLRLDQLRIIDYRPPRRVRKLTARNFSWRKDGPVQAFFVNRIAPEFLSGHFDAESDDLHFLGGTLSAVSRARIKASMTRVVQEFEQLARQDSRLPLEVRDGCSALFALRRWEFSDFTQLRRKPLV
jgi:DNA-binding Xre family transcriptional regulator